VRGKKWTYGFGGWKEGNENLINQRFEEWYAKCE